MRPDPLLLGEAPSKSGDRYWMCPLSGDVGVRLCTWAGIEPLPPQRGLSRYGQHYYALVDHFECRNLLRRYPGPQGRGAAFPMELAYPAVGRTLPDLDGRVVVMLGVRLPRAFLAPPAPMFEWRTHSITVDPDEQGAPEGSRGRTFTWRYAVIPHPSGLNRAYNDPDNIAKAQRVLREALSDDEARRA